MAVAYRRRKVFESLISQYSSKDGTTEKGIFLYCNFFLSKLKWHSVHHYFEGNYSLETFALTLQQLLQQTVPSIVIGENVMECVELSKVCFEIFSHVLEIAKKIQDGEKETELNGQLISQMLAPLVREAYSLYNLVVHGLQISDQTFIDQNGSAINENFLLPLQEHFRSLSQIKLYVSQFGNPPEITCKIVPQDLNVSLFPFPPSKNPSIPHLRELCLLMLSKEKLSLSNSHNTPSPVVSELRNSESEISPSPRGTKNPFLTPNKNLEKPIFNPFSDNVQTPPKSVTEQTEPVKSPFDNTAAFNPFQTNATFNPFGISPSEAPTFIANPGQVTANNAKNKRAQKNKNKLFDELKNKTREELMEEIYNLRKELSLANAKLQKFEN